jgi:hypothetical protein
VTRKSLLWILAFVSSLSAFGMGGMRITISGVVTDFDDRYVYLDARSERYRINRGAVPDEVRLQPGRLVDFELSLKDLRVLPATAPAVHSYKSPRKREPAEE